jgi:hypothetical protein
VAGPRSRVRRAPTARAVRRAVRIDSETLGHYASRGELITDDNQLLAFGPDRAWQQAIHLAKRRGRINLRELRELSNSRGTQ